LPAFITSGKQLFASLVATREAAQAMAPTVCQFARLLQIALKQRFFNLPLLSFKNAASIRAAVTGSLASSGSLAKRWPKPIFFPMRR